MSGGRKHQKIEELLWKCLVVGQESPRQFQRAFETSKGWFSSSSSQFPMDIILAFPKKVNIWKFVIGCSDSFLPSKVEVRVGSLQKSSDDGREPKYEDAKNAKYNKRSTITFEKRGKHEKTYESKTLFMDVIGQFVWLIVYQPYEGNTVHLKELSIFGYRNFEEHHKKDDETKKLEDKKKEDELEQEKRAQTPSDDGRSDFFDDYDDGDYRNQTMPYRSHGDGLESNGDGFGADPLTSVRLIKQVLKEKGVKATRNDKVVESTACKRAVQRLEEYEVKIIEMKKKMSQALEAKDYDYAERYRLAMIDSRDTVFRVIHLDLLLGKDELKSLGMKSKWADPELI